MTQKTVIIDGKQIAANIAKELIDQVVELRDVYGITPKLCILQVGDNPASNLYISNKTKKATSLNIEAHLKKFDNHITENTLIAEIDKINHDPSYQGIIVQLPLPKHINADNICQAVDPRKDVDGLHPVNMGYLLRNEQRGFVPCTPLGCLHLLKHYLGDIASQNIVIIGRSNIVGRPLSVLLSNENATVTLCHSYSTDIREHTLKADIIISAIGSPNFIDRSYCTPKTVVIDVGINKIGDSLTGDANFEHLHESISMITPVPGGVGPMTVIYLMSNLIKAAKATQI